ncbi:MAG: Phosphoserine phosphatase [Deltaproteobacteria bacterium]|nr:Phosphoserine phosphatase [Deltaproteobacteria bacterium]
MSKFKLALFDLDGTLTTERSAWEYIHRRLGVWDGQAEKFQQAYLRGEISYDEFCRLDAAIWKGMRVSEVKGILRQIPLQPGAGELISYLQKKLTGGIRINVHYDQKEEWVENARQTFQVQREETFAVGDSSGDIPMFRACGFSIAFNCHSPQLQSIATARSPSNNLRDLIPILIPYLGPPAKPERF